MLELKGKYTDCKVFTEVVEDQAIQQVYGFLNNEVFTNCKTRFMPDIHAGSGAVIGTTVELSQKIIPNVIGVDIGCGMLSYKLLDKELDLEALDKFIHAQIPSGFMVNNKCVEDNPTFIKKIEKVCSDINIHPSRALLSIGSLGSGNHFLELGKDEEGSLWLTVHSGSRNFGLQIAKYHQAKAEDYSLASLSEENIKKQIEIFKQKYSGKKIATEIEKIKNRAKVRKHKRTGLEYLEGELADKYIEHMKVAQLYATVNRLKMLDKIVKHFNLTVDMSVESVHNYIDFNDRIIRKGAIAAHKDQTVIIPWNMRDGLIIGKGKGNPDWNYSAPHGAGRSMSRSKAKEILSAKDFKQDMDGIFSTCVGKETIDESPAAYKDHNQVEKYLHETVEIIHRVKPIYNFKAK